MNIDYKLNVLKDLGANVEVLADGFAIHYFTSISDEFICKLIGTPRIRELSFRINARPTDGQLTRLAAMSQLRKFVMSQTSGNPGEGLSFVADLKDLTEVRCSASDPGVKCLAKSGTIQQLSLGYAPISNRSMKFIGQMKQLECLDLLGTEISGDIEHLSELKDLTDLSLEHTKIDDEALSRFLRNFKGIAGLRRLVLSGTNISDATLPDVAEAVSLEVLGLSATKVTGIGLRHLRSCVKLRDLFLNDIKLGADDIKIICEMPNLKNLWVADAKLSAEHENQIRRALPNCDIVRLKGRQK